jgi:hypothetical protein
MTRLWLTIAVAGILVATPAAADDGRRPRVEIGGTLTAAFPFPLEDSVGVLVGGGPSVTVNLTRRLAIEVRAETFGPVEESGIFGVYQTQLKIPIKRSSSGARPLVFTVGVAGAASYQRFPETRLTRADGSTIVHQEFRRFRVTNPTTFSAGVSGDRPFSRHVSGSWGIQTMLGSIGGAVLASAGVSFGLGGYR